MFTPHSIDWNRATVSRLWDFHASTPGLHDTYFSAHSGEYILQSVERYMVLQDSFVLDYGCGPGFLLERLLQRGIRCMGLEFSPRVLGGIQRLSMHPSFGGVVVAEVLPSPLPASRFDVVLCLEVIEHLSHEELDGTLRELYRLLMPGGGVVITTPFREDLTRELQMCPECGCTFHRWQHVRSWDDSTLRGLMEQYGFATTICIPTHFKPRRHFVDLIRRVYHLVCGGDQPSPHLMYIGKKV